ncbi:hypothetical protein ACIGMX_34620 [Streptomyces aquilus]|uniref:hypothetical protein n=1 Tax=Streptomyces aquilus TaxID=2548456 RepID=UPI0037D6CC8E
MRRTILLSAALMLALTSCSSGSDDKPAVKASPTVNKEERYLDTARGLPYTQDGEPLEAELLTFPPQWCASLDEGHSVEHMFSLTGENLYPVGYDWGLKKADAYELLVAGVKAYCPRNSSAVLEELRASGEY